MYTCKYVNMYVSISLYVCRCVCVYIYIQALAGDRGGHSVVVAGTCVYIVHVYMYICMYVCIYLYVCCYFGAYIYMHLLGIAAVLPLWLLVCVYISYLYMCKYVYILRVYM